MEEIAFRKLTKAEEKLLANPKLNDNQRKVIKEFWEETKLPGNKWLYWLFSLVTPLLIAGLVSLLVYPNIRVENLILFFCWAIYPLYGILFLLISALNFITDIIAESKKQEIQEKKETSEKFRKFYYGLVIQPGMIKIWAGQNKWLLTYSYLIDSALIILLAINGFIGTAIIVLIVEIGSRIFKGLNRLRTKTFLDKINQPEK